MSSVLLLENGDRLLLEGGDRLLLEGAEDVPGAPPWEVIQSAQELSAGQVQGGQEISSGLVASEQEL